MNTENPTVTISKSTCRILFALALLNIASVSTLAQIVATTGSDPAKEVEDDETIVLSPFAVTSKGDDGYTSRQTTLSSRSVKNLMELPASVQVINRQLMDDLNSDMMTALDYGVSGVNSNQKIANDVTIRGFRASLFLRNGVPSRSNFSAPNWDIERIEVLKGPLNMVLASTLVGGGVNIISRPPTSKFSSRSEVTIGNQSQYKGVYHQSGPLYRGTKHSVDYRATVGALTGENEREAISNDQKFGGGAMRFNLSPTSSLNIEAYYFLNENKETWEDFLDLSVTEKKSGFTLARLNPNSNSSVPLKLNKDNFWKVQDSFLNVTYLSKILEGGLRLSFNHQHVREKRLYIYNTPLRPDNYTIGRYFSAVTQKNINSNVQMDYRYDHKFSWVTLESTIGMDFTKTYFSFVNWLDRYQPDANIYMPDIDTRPEKAQDRNAILQKDNAFIYNQFVPYPAPRPGGTAATFTVADYGYYNDTVGTSWYFQEVIKLFNDKLSLIGGIRYSNGNQARVIYYDQKSVVINQWRSNGNGDLWGRAFSTFKAGVIYQVLPSLAIYAQNAENVILRAGILRVPGFDGPLDPGETLENQAGGVKEVGLKFDHSFTDRFGVTGSIVYFDQYLTNVNTLIASPVTGKAYPTQSARDQIKGLEYDIVARMRTDMGKTDLILTVYDTDGLTATKQLVNNHNWKVISLFAKHAFTTGSLRGLYLGGGVVDKGDKRAGGSWIVESKPTYTLLSGYKVNSKLSLQANVHNLTNERNIVGVAEASAVQVIDPRRYTLTIRYDY